MTNAEARHTAETEASVSSENEAGENVAAAAILFRTLGDPTRLLILRHLVRGEHRVVDLMSHLGLAQSTVSGHLACLRECGLVRSRAQGRASLYSLARPELLDLFHVTESFLEATGERVVLHHTGHDHGLPPETHQHRPEHLEDGKTQRPLTHRRAQPAGLELSHESSQTRQAQTRQPQTRQPQTRQPQA